MTDVDYTDDQALLTNTPAKAKYLLLNQKQATLVFMWTQIKRSLCDSNKNETFPLICENRGLGDLIKIINWEVKVKRQKNSVFNRIGDVFSITPAEK